MILEDKNGYLWLATHGGGLARFDGRQFKVYTTLDGLLSNIIISLKLDSKQNLWIIHPRGMTKFDGVRFRKFAQAGSPINAIRIRKVFEQQDTIFFLTPNGLGKIYNDSVYYWSKPIVPEASVWFSFDVSDKSTVFGMSDSTFYVKSSEGDYTLNHRDKFSTVYNGFRYGGKFWLLTNKGHFIIDFDKRAFIPANIPVRNFVVFYDSMNNVFWTEYGTVLMKEKINGQTVAIDTVMKDAEVKQVLVDSEGNTWFATHGTGLFKYFIQDFDRRGPEEVKVVMAIHRDVDGAIWVGSTTMGLWKIKNGKVRSYVDKHEPFRNQVHTIVESPDHTLWIGTSFGMGRYNRATDSFSWLTPKDGLSSPMVISIQFDENQNIYTSSFTGGIDFYDGKSFRHITTKDGLSSNNISACYYSRYYKKLFAGNEFGVSACSGGSVEPISIPEIENTSILSIYDYRDSLLLIGSAGAGIAIYNPASRQKTIITTHQGLPSDFIYFVASDPEGYIWIGTEKGITRLKVNDELEILENLHYDYDNGLTGVETNQNAFYLSTDLKLFGLIDGLYEFNDIHAVPRKSFDLHLTSVDLFYGEYDIRDYAKDVSGFFRIPVDPILPPEINHITFAYNRVDKRYPKSVKFRYLLENFDKTWSQPSSNNEVTYSNLPPGDYTFRVMATDNLGGWSRDSLAYPFTVKAPFYKTASFLVGLFILFAGAVTLALYIRVKNRISKAVMLERIRTREQESLRKEIARDFHDEMGNQLTRIINYVSLLKLNGEKHGMNGNADLYAKVEDSAKYLYTGTRDFIWSIDPGNDELSKLFLHIRDFGEKLFDEKNISFRAYNDVKDRFKLPYGFSREANLIFKEAMTNAFKYSGASNVSLSLLKIGDRFELAFEDDGIGFNTSEIEKSNGLKNIRERADRLRAVLRIQSNRNKGTRIVLNFELNKTLKYGLTL
jgi:signal transduction histidine kinase/ligand-binding sensor domain-containing protein